MRTPLVLLAGSVLFVGCGGGIVYVPAPAPVSTSAQRPASAPAQKPTPAPASKPVAPPVPVSRPAPVAMPPVGVTIVRADESRLLVSTNQPAYLVVFEIVPERGATLVYPQSARQRPAALSGSNWLAVSWPSPRAVADGRYARDGRDVQDPRRRGERTSTRYVYAIASERPLRLTDRAFDDDKLRELVGTRASRAADPYETMEALSRRFVPAQMDDEEWGEDLYTIEVTRPGMPERVARVYCPDGSVTYVRDDRADRDWCASRGGGRGPGRGGATNPRADSVVAWNGRPIDHRMRPTGPTIFRVPKPEVVQAGKPGNGGGGSNGDADDRQGRGREGRDPTSGGSTRGNGDADNRQGRDHEDNGNHYGRDGGRDTVRQKGNANGNDGESSDPRGRSGGKPEQPVREAPVRGKPEQRPIMESPMVREAKPEVKPEPKPEAKPEPRGEGKPESEASDHQRGRGQPASAPPREMPAAPVSAEQPPRETTPDSAAARPDRRRPNPRARADSSDDTRRPPTDRQ
jgi:hypothetical protein